MELLFKIMHSSFFENCIIIPLAIIGFYQIFRGITTIIEKDFNGKEWPSAFWFYIYIAVTILGCICFISIFHQT